MALLGGQSDSVVAVDTFNVQRLATTDTTVSLSFSNTGSQFHTVNSSNTILRNWVTPATDASKWEIRATVESGATPDGSPLNTWLPLNLSRSWGLSSLPPGSFIETSLTFDFRRVGDTLPEVTSTGNIIYIEVLDIFR